MWKIRQVLLAFQGKSFIDYHMYVQNGGRKVVSFTTSFSTKIMFLMDGNKYKEICSPHATKSIR